MEMRANLPQGTLLGEVRSMPFPLEEESSFYSVIHLKYQKLIYTYRKKHFFEL
jgi:hypothetical protein